MIGPGDPIRIPPVEGRIVHEGELVVVIGKIAKQVPVERWADYVFGYTVGNDVSARDQMFADGQWARAKGYDTFAPLGPWIETELDPSALEIRTWVDGEPRRHGNTRDLLHKVPELIAYISDVWTLLPGDVIMTGTPSGHRRVRARPDHRDRDRGDRHAQQSGPRSRRTRRVVTAARPSAAFRGRVVPSRCPAPVPLRIFRTG